MLHEAAGAAQVHRGARIDRAEVGGREASGRPRGRRAAAPSGVRPRSPRDRSSRRRSRGRPAVRTDTTRRTRSGRPVRRAVAEHGHQRHDAGAAADQQRRRWRRPRRTSRRSGRAPRARRPAPRRRGGRSTPRRRAGSSTVSSISPESSGRRRDRVRARRGVAVLCGEPDDVVLARRGAATGASRAQAEGAGRGRLVVHRDDGGRLPRRGGLLSRCVEPPGGGEAGSVTLVALLEPRVAAVVVAVLLPEARLVVVEQPRGPRPTWRSSRSTGGARAAGPGPPCSAGSGAPSTSHATQALPAGDVGERAGWSCSRCGCGPARGWPAESGRAAPSSVSTETPVKVMSNFDHVVTQWMSPA